MKKKVYEIIETGLATVIAIYDVEERYVIATYNMAADEVYFMSDETHPLEPIKRLIRYHYKGLHLEVNPISVDFTDYE